MHNLCWKPILWGSFKKNFVTARESSESNTIFFESDTIYFESDTIYLESDTRDNELDILSLEAV